MVRRWEGEAEGSGGKRASQSSEVAVTAQGTRTVMGPEEPQSRASGAQGRITRSGPQVSGGWIRVTCWLTSDWELRV